MLDTNPVPTSVFLGHYAYFVPQGACFRQGFHPHLYSIIYTTSAATNNYRTKKIIVA